MSRGLEASLSEFQGFPRVSGDEPKNEGVFRESNLFSPRERG